MDLSEARVLVTGGSRGIGKEVARRLLASGARVAISGRDAQVVQAAAAELDCTGIPGDVSVEADAEAMVAGTVGALGGYDTLINNAAIGSFAPLLETEAADMESVWRVNVLGAFLVGRATARHFVEQGGGSLINVGSTAAGKGFPGGSAYAASKFALTGLTECWRAELRPHGVRVMQINPSEVQTGFGGRAPTPNETKLQASDIAEAMVAMLAMPDRGFTTDLTIWATNPQ